MADNGEKYRKYNTQKTRNIGAAVKPKKRVSAGYLERAALHYLGRFSSSEHNLKQVLLRKVRRRNEENTPATAEQMQWIDNIVAKCVQYEYVNDLRYATQRTTDLLRKGKPVRIITQDLKHKGIAQDVITDTINALSQDEDTNPDMRAAAAYVRRRRFGPFRKTDNVSDNKAEKELAAMMRAGFRYDIAREALLMNEDDLIEQLA